MTIVLAFKLQNVKKKISREILQKSYIICYTDFLGSKIYILRFGDQNQAF